jgi:hypothetical protein
MLRLDLAHQGERRKEEGKGAFLKKKQSEGMLEEKENNRECSNA